MKNIELARKDMYVTVQKEGRTFLLTVEELISFFENSKKENSKTEIAKQVKTYKDIPDDFTGICKVADSGEVYHMKDGKRHNEAEPAVIWKDGTKIWYINDLEHREDGPAIEYTDGGKHWYYKGNYYGKNNDFTNETWKEKVAELKSQGI